MDIHIILTEDRGPEVLGNIVTDDSIIGYAVLLTSREIKLFKTQEHTICRTLKHPLYLDVKEFLLIYSWDYWNAQ